MGEGAARAIAIGSIVLTVALLTVAVIFSRKRSRIRVGFDVARAVVGVVAITEMARITGVTTPGVAMAIAIAVGLGLGFAQGSSLEVSSSERGFYATRSPIGIALWGIGIVLMQGAGIAARTGTLRVGQTIAWFSACLGIGLMAGRKGPLQNAKKALAGAGVAAFVAVLVGPALITGTASPAVAETRELDHSQLYELVEAPLSPGLVAAQAAARLALADEHILTSDELCQLFPTDEGLAIETTILEGVPACNGQRGTLTEAGTHLSVYVFAYGDADEAASVALVASQNRTSIGGLGQAAVQSYTTHGDEDPWVTTTIFVLRGPYTLTAPGVAVEQELAAKALLAEIDAKLAALLEQADAVDDMSGQGDAPASDTVQGDGVDGGDGDGSLLPSVDAEGDGVDGGEPLTPEKAAEQAVAGLIAAAAMGVITWAEAGAEIGRILGGGPLPPTYAPLPAQTTTIVLTGADAEAVLSGGVGTNVPIPGDQQWGQNVSVPDGTIRTDPVGSRGVVRSVGPIVRGPDGQISISVEVGPPPPPPPPPEWIDLDPIIGPEPEIWPPMPRRPPPLDPYDDTLTPEDLRDPDFREWLDDQQAFGEKVAGWHRDEGEFMDWLHFGGRVIYSGVDQSIHLLANFTGPLGQGVKENWNIAKHLARATGRSLVDGEWSENMLRSGVEYWTDKAWSAGFGWLTGMKSSRAPGLSGVPLLTAPTVGQILPRLNITPSQMSKSTVDLLSAGLSKFAGTRASKIAFRNPMKNATGIFDWSPPWPNLP